VAGANKSNSAKAKKRKAQMRDNDRAKRRPVRGRDAPIGAQRRD
jgi:hypothetical protein